MGSQLATGDSSWRRQFTIRDVFQVLMALIEDHQAVEDEEGKLVIEDWKEEVVTQCDKKTMIVLEIIREQAFQVRGIQDSLRAMFNPHFGSTFRSHNNPTYFSRKLFRFINDIYALKEKPYNIIHRFSDIYTSRVTNLLQYSLNHSFYPRSEILVCCCHQFLFFSQEGVCLCEVIPLF